MSRRSVPSLLHDLIVHAERLRDIYAAARGGSALLQDRTSQDAVLWNLVVIGEIAQRLGEEFQSAHPGVPWARIISQRNIIAHGYDVLDWAKLIPVLRDDVPSLLTSARTILDSFGPAPQR